MACFQTLSTTNLGFTFVGTNNGTIDVLTPLGCFWSASTTNTWITIAPGSSGTNTGTVTYSVLSNGTSLTRSGVIAIAGQTVTVTQTGVACFHTLSTTNLAFTFFGTNNRT